MVWRNLGEFTARQVLAWFVVIGLDFDKIQIDYGVGVFFVAMSIFIVWVYVPLVKAVMEIVDAHRLVREKM